MHKDSARQTMGDFSLCFILRHFVISFYDAFSYYELVIKMKQCN